MKLAFEPNLSYQRKAIQSITGLFEGQTEENAVKNFATQRNDTSSLSSFCGNKLTISEEQIDKNIKVVQQQNAIDTNFGGVGKHGMHFSVEMETGTGKTYVYLRSIYELNKLYGFKKFVVVVPSLAIREGVLKSLEITHAHFQNLYNNVPLNFQVYDSTKASSLRGFARADNIEILVLNIDSFAKDENIINKPNDKLNGRKPREFIQCTHPIVIVDEPQNMETGKRKKAIANLNALCTLRFSATHRKLYNLIYSLNPVKAYDLGLVKQIEVDSVFAKGQTAFAGETQDALRDEVMKIQIRKTIEEHLKKEKQLNRLGIKVLSLFFVDRVASYRQYHRNGNPKNGKFAEWFESIYREYIAKPAYNELDRFGTAETHKAYFSQDRRGAVKDTSGETKADNDTYRLIMKDKEKLLSMDNPLRFIFSHSALREGWDNPNVFQICTLNETKSDMKKRQEIGRGLRLCVDQSGVRCYDQNINRLTVIANESYEGFAKALQKEIETDCGVQFSGRIKNRHHRIAITYRRGFENDPLFIELWNKLKPKTNYLVDFKTEELIARASDVLKKLPPVSETSIRSAKAIITRNSKGLDTGCIAGKTENREGAFEIPDVLDYVQHKTGLTRSAIAEIFHQSGRIGDLVVNPQLFLNEAVQAINGVLSELKIENIQYKKIKDLKYDTSLFETYGQEVYRNDLLFKVNNPAKTIYEAFIPLSSIAEKHFARECDNNPLIKFYFKLPDWYSIPTPAGSHKPGWAVVVEGHKQKLFVVDLKGKGTAATGFSELKCNVQMKIKCALAHFEVLEDLEYKVVSGVGELIGGRKRCQL